MERLGLYFVRLRTEGIGASITGIFFGFRVKRAIALEVAKIHLMDQKRKVEGSFGFYSDGFPNSLISGSLLIAFCSDKA